MAEGEAQATCAGLPWPAGDVDGLRGTASRLAAAARDFADLGTQIGDQRADGAGWAGPAARRFDLSASREATTLGQAADGLHDAGQALRTLADTVAEAQEQVGRLAHRVLELEDQAARASHIASWITPDRPDSPAATRARRVADQLDGELTALRERAVARAEDACEEARRADRRCAATLSALAASAPLAGDVAPTMPATPLAMAVAVAYAPEYRFDEDEDHFPMDVGRWLANADRRHGDQGRFLDPQGEDIRNGDLPGATLPFAYHVTADGDLQLEYGTFYAFNDFPDSPSVPRLVGDVIGEKGPDHEGDFEPVTVQLGAGGRPEAVDFEAHGHTGVVPWDETERDGLHPRVYVAHGGHGNHPHAGRYENDVSGIAQNVTDATGWAPAPPVSHVHGVATLGDHWEDEADGDGEVWRPGAAQILDARAVPELRSDSRFGEDQGDGNPLPFLHPDQGPPPDLDGPGAAPHAGPATGVDEIGIAKDLAGEAVDVLDDVPLPPVPSPPSLPFP